MITVTTRTISTAMDCECGGGLGTVVLLVSADEFGEVKVMVVKSILMTLGADPPCPGVFSPKMRFDFKLVASNLKRCAIRQTLHAKRIIPKMVC